MISNFYLYISWNVDPAIYDGFITLRYYSLFFALSFLIGFQIVKKMFDNEFVPVEWMDKLLVYTVLGTILGARLGHVLFYEPNYYLENISEILMVWKGGLASHGAAIGVLTGIFIFQKLNPFKPLIWILDRLTIPAAIGGVFIRTGNFFNSEIVGKYTGSNFGVVFENRGEILPRYPAQMYEAFGYFILFLVLKKIYNSRYRDQGGFLMGLYFAGTFTIRFFVEYVKESQGGFEEIFPALSTGQWLSIPFITFGLVISALSFFKKSS